jgi:three-Cys-motif partner protein
MPNESFFEEHKEQSRIKAEIVRKYFWSWAKIIIPRSAGNKIAYIDLFAGPGRYVNGTKSTPLLILETAIADEQMRNALVCLFNDADPEHAGSLRAAIASLPGIETLKHSPTVSNYVVGDELVSLFNEMNLIPTFFFVDPWGYKGLSLGLINSVLRNWGTDCIFFFNYNRINMGLPNEMVDRHLNALFGQERADQLRQKLVGLKPFERELMIVEELSQALREMGGRYVLPFTFKNEKGNRTSHHLIFVSKHPLGYKIMKNVMAGESSSENQGVPSFEFNPATREQPLLLQFARPLDDLEGMLLKDFQGQTVSFNQLFEAHHIDTPFIEKNYRQALRNLEDKGLIRVFSLSPKRRKAGTYGEHTRIEFPTNP